MRYLATGGAAHSKVAVQHALQQIVQLCLWQDMLCQCTLVPSLDQEALPRVPMRSASGMQATLCTLLFDVQGRGTLSGMLCRHAPASACCKTTSDVRATAASSAPGAAPAACGGSAARPCAATLSCGTDSASAARCSWSAGSTPSEATAPAARAYVDGAPPSAPSVPVMGCSPVTSGSASASEHGQQCALVSWRCSRSAMRCSAVVATLGGMEAPCCW